MAKLNQINALVTGRKGEAEKVVGDIYKILQKPELFVGRERMYRPFDAEQGEKLPPETQKVQQRTTELIKQAVTKWSELWNLTFIQDAANQSAKADILVDKQIVLKDVPVTSLLFLEKQLNDVETFFSRMPTPDFAEEWTHDPTTGLLRSKVSSTARTKKEPAAFVKYPATKEHPAQVEYYLKDVPVGTWENTSFSAAMTVDQKNAILARVKKLKDAVKIAREQANSCDAPKVEAAEPIFNYILGDKGL